MLSTASVKQIAIISDIHGNIPALEAVLGDIKNRNIRSIICLGDLAGKGPNPAETVDLIQNHCEVVVKGNGNFFMTERKAEFLNWHQIRLGLERVSYMKSLDMYREFQMSGKLIRLCHASPHSVLHRTHICTDRVERMRLFEPVPGSQRESDVVGYGDTHNAYVDHFAGKTSFNTGSAGNPTEIPQASYAILEGEYDSQTAAPFFITIARIPYDVDLAVKHAEESDLPDKAKYITELLTATYRGSK